MAKRSLRMVCCLAAVLALAGCGRKSTSGGSIKRAAVKSEEVQFASPQNGDTVAVFDTSLGEVRAVLYPQYAPMAVENFVGLSQAGYYNETVLFRVEPGFAVEGGDASGEGTGGTTIWNGGTMWALCAPRRTIPPAAATVCFMWWQPSPTAWTAASKAP